MERRITWTRDGGGRNGGCAPTYIDRSLSLPFDRFATLAFGRFGLRPRCLAGRALPSLFGLLKSADPGKGNETDEQWPAENLEPALRAVAPAEPAAIESPRNGVLGERSERRIESRRRRVPRGSAATERDRTPILLVATAALILSLLPAATLQAQQDAQQDTTRARPPATDTVSPAQAVPADTLTTRERALRRLRAMRVDPVQPDTVPSDTVAADTAAADTVSFDPLVPGPLPIPADTPRVDRPVEGEELGERLPDRPVAGVEIGDTVVAFGGDQEVTDEVLVADSVLALLRSLAGYQVTEYSGESAVFRAEGEQLELRGESRVGRGREALETDSLLVYDGASGIVCGYGTPVLSGEQDPIESDELCFNIERNVGVAVAARTQFQQGATWYVRGARNRVWLLTGGEKNALYGERTEFTSCELDHPHYTFRARSLKMVEDEMMVARNITLRFDDVPVFWLPWMVQSMKRDRRSGLLMPEFGVNDIVRNSTGYNRSISNLGFYWAINDYASAKGTFEWYSSHWTAVEGALTYRWLRQFLQGSVTAKQFWREQEGAAGTREFTLNTSNSWQPDERTRLQLNANYATSSEFVRDNSFDPRELNRKITSSASASRSFDWGSVSAGADRNEQLSTGQVDWKLPGLSVNLAPVTLSGGDGGLDLTWNGRGGLTRRTRESPDTLGLLDSETLDADFNHTLSLGRLGLTQRVRWNDEALRGPMDPLGLPSLPGTVPVDDAGRVLDTIGETGFRLGEQSASELDWSTSLSYQQVLWPGTVVSPNISINGTRVRNDSTAGEFVAAPNRISTGASLNTSIYGFWPGFGNFSRIRHKIAPTLRWSYSPGPDVSPLQERVFDTPNLREQNRISLSFNQTFEAKVRDDSPAETPAANGAEEAEGVDGADADVGEAGAEREGGRNGEPTRLPQAEKVMLLALDTRSEFVYDFVAAEQEGRGFQTTEISNSIRSDLLRGFQLTTRHSLFETTGTPPAPGALAPRRFNPFLTSLSASFSIDHEFWLFEVLGLTSRAGPPAGPGDDSGPREPDVEGAGGADDPSVGAEADPDGAPGQGSIIPSGGAQDPDAQGSGPGWRASLNYSLDRLRPGAIGGGSDSQLLSGNVAFQPTPLWSVRWSTAYSFTDREFSNHVLTLSRDLHRWQANFDFVKAQNGNFAMRFRVQLRDNPDLKFDYDQRTDPSDRARAVPPPAAPPPETQQ